MKWPIGRRLEVSPEADDANPASTRPDLLRALATRAQEERDWGRAHDLWKQAVERESSFVGGWVQLGNMRNELADYPGALDAFAKAAQLDPNSYDAFAGMAGVHERAGQWHDAHAAWLLATQYAGNDAGRSAHAYAHAMLAAHHTGDNEGVAKTTILAVAAAPDFLNRPESLLVQARLLRKDQPKMAKVLLWKLLDGHPNDTAARFEFCSICLDDGEYRNGLDVIEPCLAQPRIDGSFVWLAADLHERLRHWTDVFALCERMMAADAREIRFLRRGFDAAIRLGDLIAARRIARLFATGDDGELELIDRLCRAYEDTGDTRRARYLCRWLARRWPHSHWHIGRYITLTAGALGLLAADRLTREYHARCGRNAAIDRAYSHAAFVANEHAEAQRRLEWYLAQDGTRDNDPDSEVLLGYVLANTAGLETAEQYFLSLAARSFQSYGALVGVAHMAARRRDVRATLELWTKISAVYPRDAIARVESARAAYNFGDFARARSICEERLKTLPSDTTMGEFYAWLLVATGDYTAALTYLPTLLQNSGPNWAGLEAAVQCAGQRGTLDEEWPGILRFLPRASTKVASDRVYHIVRRLLHFGCPALASTLLKASNVDPRQAAWVAPYCSGGDLKVDVQLSRPANVLWRHLAAHISDHTARQLRQMSNAEVQAALETRSTMHPVVHIINKFEQARGGSELHALDLATRIAAHAQVELWAPEAPHPYFSMNHKVQAVDQSRGRSPYGGVLVFIGVYFRINWIVHTRPERIIFLYNTFEAPTLFERIAEAFALTGVRPELVFCSDMMGKECGLPGFFEPSPIDINLFIPETARRPRPFTLGRHSRDVIEKHNAEDIRIYQAVAELGGRSDLLGGTCMRPVFAQASGLNLLPARTTGIVEFLQDIDAYFYRTSTWVEPWGRVVIEAMGCALPVLVHDAGGYAQVIRHEENGLLFHTTAEAVALVRRLVQDSTLRQRLGQAARASVEQLLGPDAMARLVMFYIMRDRDQGC